MHNAADGPFIAAFAAGEQQVRQLFGGALRDDGGGGLRIERGLFADLRFQRVGFGLRESFLHPENAGEREHGFSGKVNFRLVERHQILVEPGELFFGFAGREDGAGVEIVAAGVAGGAQLPRLGFGPAGFGAVGASGGFLSL